MLADVTPDMTLAKEEIFGPVLVVMPYQTEEEALEIANDSIFGLGGYVFSEDRKRGYEFSCGLRAGRISYNGANTNSFTPMGGYKQSGIGRSMGVLRPGGVSRGQVDLRLRRGVARAPSRRVGRVAELHVGAPDDSAVR